FALRVTPRASRARLDMSGEQMRAYVTAPPENGKANEAVRKMLAKALKVAPSRLTLISGATSRQKLFELTL
ncbi:MAG: DUF167 domain-containing protein, partial [Rhodobacteraceae bacterium]|nr:DUF167 domain-containing protein [Paracoccaceae bacterium]